MLCLSCLRTQIFLTSHLEKCVGMALKVGAPAGKPGQNDLPRLTKYDVTQRGSALEVNFVNGNDQLKGE
ncbi:hypothetical protein LDENG_00251350 [Lucifuga dentata]|nr:hypothetical protein LDENG_00251350 [Lucifuga dentata]